MNAENFESKDSKEVIKNIESDFALVEDIHRVDTGSSAAFAFSIRPKNESLFDHVNSVIETIVEAISQNSEFDEALREAFSIVFDGDKKVLVVSTSFEKTDEKRDDALAVEAVDLLLDAKDMFMADKAK